MAEMMTKAKLAAVATEAEDDEKVPEESIEESAEVKLALKKAAEELRKETNPELWGPEAMKKEEEATKERQRLVKEIKQTSAESNASMQKITDYVKNDPLADFDAPTNTWRVTFKQGVNYRLARNLDPSNKSDKKLAHTAEFKVDEVVEDGDSTWALATTEQLWVPVKVNGIPVCRQLMKYEVTDLDALKKEVLEGHNVLHS